jgi:hypothetical protein
MEENQTLAHRPSRKETLSAIRRDIQKLRQEQRQDQLEVEEDPKEYKWSRSSPLLPRPAEEGVLNQAEERERERERAFASPSPSGLSALDTPASGPSSENGWDQGDGRRADQLVAYERLPDSIRHRLEPTKGTHFRFRNSSDEQALLQALTTATQTATYQTTGKKDVSITSVDGRLLGNIHFLHMDSRDIHHPEKYYMKFYLFNFSDSGVLRDTKQRLLSFTQTFFSPSRPSRPSRPVRSVRSVRSARSARSVRPSRPSRKSRPLRHKLRRSTRTRHTQTHRRHRPHVQKRTHRT